MKWAFRLTAAILIAVVVLIMDGGEAMTQSVTFEYFPETGHSVEGDFLNYYRSIPNPETLYGFPITDAFFGVDGVQVQYFQLARFERSPDGSIVQTQLGRLLYEPGEVRVTRSFNNGACQSFENGFQVCTAFLDFFNANGGKAQFGVPISEIELHGDRYVQYFENTRMQWHPDSTAIGLEIRLSELGRFYFDRAGEDPSFLNLDTDAPIIEVTRLQAHVFSERAAVRETGVQRLFVVVQDQNFRPMAGTPYQITVAFPGQPERAVSGLTNDLGYGEVSLDLARNGAEAGFVHVRLTANFQGLESRSNSSFRIIP